MKKTVSLILAAALAALLSACSGSAASSIVPATTGSTATSTAAGGVDYTTLDPVELIGADSAGKGAAGQLFGQLVADKVSEITGGQLTISYHSNGEMGSDEELLSQLQSDDIQLLVSQPATTISYVPENAVFDLPMAFTSYSGDAIDAVLNGDTDFRAALSTAYENAGFHLLGFLQNGTYRLTTADKDLSTLADFQGLRIRTMDNVNHMAFWSAIGADPSPVEWSQLYFALQNDTIEAQENAADSCASANLQEVQSYLACTNHLLYCNQICMNQQAWQALDPAYQSALVQAVEQAIDDLRPDLDDMDEQSKQKLVDGGMQLIEYSDDFYNAVLATEGVKELYAQIDADTNGLAATLQNDLANA